MVCKFDEIYIYICFYIYLGAKTENVIGRKSDHMTLYKQLVLTRGWVIMDETDV